MNANEVQIEAPCHQNWDAMSGEAKRRFCSSCNEHVHDLSAMTEPEARAVIEQPDVCVRYRSDASGRMVFKVGRLARAAAVLGMLTSTAQAAGSVEDLGFLARLSDWIWGSTTEQVITMGEVSRPTNELVFSELEEDSTAIPELSGGSVIPELTVHPVRPPVVEKPQEHRMLMGRVAPRMPPANTP